MMTRESVRRVGVALVITGLFFSRVDVNPAGEIAGAFADESAAAVPAAQSPQPAPAPPPPDPPGAAAPQSSAFPAPQSSPSALAVTQNERAPEGGDLTHLTFTATEALSAVLVAPADDGVANGTSASIEVETVRGAGVELKVGDAVVPFSRIGKRTVDDKTGVTRYTYYGVDLVPGPNLVVLTPVGANGFGETTRHRIYGPGRPATLGVVASGPFRADGVSADVVRVEARDAWGHHAAAGSVVQVVLAQGDARLERVGAAQAATSVTPATTSTSPVPLTTSSPGVVNAAVGGQRIDVVLDADGAATLRLIPGLTPGAVLLRAECGDAMHETRFFLAPNLRKPFVTGLLSAGAGAVPGIPDAPDGLANGTNSRRGRVALFGTGAMGKSLATFAYDTADTLQRSSAYGGALGTYSGDPKDRPYSTF